MSLVWAEPWDQYGGTASLIAQSGYSQSPNGLNSFARTGGWSMSSATPAIRPLNTPTNKIGQGFAIWANGTTPYTSDFNTTGARWYSSGNTQELSLGGNLQLGVTVYDRNHVAKGSTAPNLLISSGWTWIEVVAIQNTGGANTGYVEVRIQGIQRLVINGIDLPNQFTAHGVGGFFGGFFLDDWICWDGLGTVNNTFLGDRRLVCSFPNANGATQNFTASAGSAFNCVNQVPPVDTTYIEGTAAGNISDFAKAGIGIAATDIAAVVVGGRAFKTDAGVATGQLGINSAGNVLNQAAFAPGTTGSYFYFPVEQDPNGNVAWTRTNADNALIRVTRAS